MKRVRHSRQDAQVREFATKDLGRAIARGGGMRVVQRPSRPTSILLGDDLIRRLREKGAKRGLGYQTMLKVIVREHLEEY